MTWRRVGDSHLQNDAGYRVDRVQTPRGVRYTGWTPRDGQGYREVIAVHDTAEKAKAACERHARE